MEVRPRTGRAWRPEAALRVLAHGQHPSPSGTSSKALAEAGDVLFLEADVLTRLWAGAQR